ncbi:MAG: TM2 domain-containing protein [Prevotella sp.]|nr:TM2 domain-containing protein [Prevotella sp.]
MEKEKVDMFIMSNGECFPEEQIYYIRERLLNLDENKSSVLYAMSFKKPTLVLILSIFLGSLGIDRFFIGDTGIGVGKLLTCGGAGIWTIIDWFLIQDATKQANFKKLMLYV